MSDRILTDADCLAIVQASIAPDRVLGGPDGETPDGLLVTVEQILAEHTQALEAEVERLRNDIKALASRWGAEGHMSFAMALDDVLDGEA